MATTIGRPSLLRSLLACGPTEVNKAMPVASDDLDSILIIDSPSSTSAPVRPSVCGFICTVREGLTRVFDIVAEPRHGVTGTQDWRDAQDREHGKGQHRHSLAHCNYFSSNGLRTPRRKRGSKRGSLLFQLRCGRLPNLSSDPGRQRRSIVRRLRPACINAPASPSVK